MADDVDGVFREFLEARPGDGLELVLAEARPQGARIPVDAAWFLERVVFGAEVKVSNHAGGDPRGHGEQDSVVGSGADHERPPENPADDALDLLTHQRERLEVPHVQLSVRGEVSHGFRRGGREFRGGGE